MAEARIEEAGVMHAELARHRHVGGHLGRHVGGHMHALAAGEDVEGAGVEDHAARDAARDRLPELERVVMVGAVEVDQPGVGLGAPAQRPGARGEVHAEGHAAIHPRRAADQPRILLQPGMGGIVQPRRAGAEAHLGQALAGARQHAEGARADLGPERAGVTRVDAVELGPAIGDHAREDIEPAGRAFGVGGARNVGGQGQPLHESSTT